VITGGHRRLPEQRPLLGGFFLAGLVIHGGLQGWWVAPVLASLSEEPLFFASAVLTAFNDNALITYLATLVPNLPDALKVAVVEGAVTGGGLTAIANAPNPAGQALLSRFFGCGDLSRGAVGCCPYSNAGRGDRVQGVVTVSSIARSSTYQCLIQQP
jgi:hypothetical protein